MGAFPRGGPADLGLVILTGVVSHGSTGVEDAAAVDDVDASWVRRRGVLHPWLFRSSFVFWSRRRPLPFPFSLSVQQQISKECVPDGFVPLSRSSLWWPAPRRCRGFPRCPFHECDGFHRPTPVLCQSPDRSRAKTQPCSQQRVRQQPYITFLRVRSWTRCQNQLCICFEPDL